MPEPRGGRRLLFWVLTLLLPFALAGAALELGLRAYRARQAPSSAEDLGRRLLESRQAEVRVVSAGSLKGLIQPSSSPDLVYELKPNRQWLFVGAETRTNSLGFRGREYAPAKPIGTRRIVGLGDSVMFAWGVKEEDGYLAALERELSRAAGVPVEALNLAVPGYNTIQEAAAFELKGLALQPDALLIGYCLNDWAAPFFLPNPDKAGALVEKSLLFQVLSERLGRNAEREHPMQGMDRVHQALDKLAALARERGIPVAFFIYPQPVKPEHREKLRSMAESRGFHYVDMYQAFEAYYAEKGLRGLGDLVIDPQDGHPNAEAHGLIARTLAPTLLSLLGDGGAAPGPAPDRGHP